jgi:class 3 adenylate cyclase/AmiR/NasT family two-component response regulator
MPDDLPKKSILAVDDTPENLDIVKAILAPEYAVRVAINGETALKIAKSRHPDLILLDIMMPEMDGYEVCRRLKSDPATNNIPIIFVTAMDQTTDETKGFELGAADYILKPFSPPILYSRVKTHLALKHHMDAMRVANENMEAANKLVTEKNQMLESLSTKLSKYLSPQVYESIFSGKQDVKVTSQRKKLTIFFSDIVGFTETTDNLEAEELSNLLNHYLTEMSEIALKYGGTIDKYIGDAMLLFFGDPESKGTKEDATACVHMAIAMQRRMQELEQEWRDRGLVQPFRIRIGITTGFCTVGNFGSPDRMDYTIIGNEVNLAARLETSAEAGGILIAHETYSLVKDSVMAEEQRPLTVKGFDRPILSYKVAGGFDDLIEEGKIIREEQDGVKIMIDLTKQGKSSVIQTIREVLSKLEV